MYKNYLLLLLLSVLLQSCSGPQPQQKTPPRKVHSKMFSWTIIIPENFEKVSAEQWAVLQDKGAHAMEQTIDAPVDDRPEIIFVFRSGQLNYLESNYQPFDTLTDGSYRASCKLVNDVMYQTFASQMPGAVVDTGSSTEQIDNLEFQVFRIKVQYPNKIVLHARMFSRLFGNKEFSVNIMYTDEEKGEKMLDAWRKSSFHAPPGFL